MENLISHFLDKLSLHFKGSFDSFMYMVSGEVMMLRASLGKVSGRLW